MWHPNWVILAPNGSLRPNILKLIFKSPRFVPFEANLTKFDTKFDIHLYLPFLFFTAVLACNKHQYIEVPPTREPPWTGIERRTKQREIGATNQWITHYNAIYHSELIFDRLSHDTFTDLMPSPSHSHRVTITRGAAAQKSDCLGLDYAIVGSDGTAFSHNCEP